MTYGHYRKCIENEKQSTWKSKPFVSSQNLTCSTPYEVISKTAQPRDKSVQPRDKSVQPRDKSIQPRDKSVQPRDKSVQPRDS